MKIFDIGFPYKHCYFKLVCLLVKMASKTVIRPIGFIFLLRKRSRYISDVTFIVSNSYQPTNQRAGSLTVTVKKKVQLFLCY